MYDKKDIVEIVELAWEDTHTCTHVTFIDGSEWCSELKDLNNQDNPDI